MERDNLGRFAKGGVETAEEKVKRLAAVMNSMSSRKNFIGDIKDECPKIYNSWRAIRHTQKGKKAGCCEEWESFRAFYNDVRPSYEKGLVLRRKDNTMPWSRDNFMWVTLAEAGEIRSKVTLTYNGMTMSLKEWSYYAGVPMNALKLRYYKHSQDYSVEEVIYGRRVKRGHNRPKDISECQSIRAKASKMISSYKARDKKIGLSVCDITIDWMIENILKRPCTYCGDTRRIGCDRIDNSKGHTMDNVVPCCVECNNVRNDFFSYREMLLLGEKIREIKKSRNEEQA